MSPKVLWDVAIGGNVTVQIGDASQSLQTVGDALEQLRCGVG